jgi:superoxide dismutase, Fe-Mn family
MLHPSVQICSTNTLYFFVCLKKLHQLTGLRCSTQSTGSSSHREIQTVEEYTLPDLPNPFDVLEPSIDALLYHDRHHATYVNNLNAATEGRRRLPLVDLPANTMIRNNGGGHYNHAFFWENMAPVSEASQMMPSPQLEALIDSSFGSFDEMKSEFEAKAAPGVTFGSGWVWLVVNRRGARLRIVNTRNQDNPLMRGVTDSILYPILGLDVWEHAYCLKVRLFFKIRVWMIFCLFFDEAMAFVIYMLFFLAFRRCFVAFTSITIFVLNT